MRVFGLLIRMVVTFSVFTFLIYQIVAPNLENLLSDLEATGGRYTTSILAEYWLKLTITNTYMWLLMFYFYFHLYMNFFAELLRFGDRVFCKSFLFRSSRFMYFRLEEGIARTHVDAFLLFLSLYFVVDCDPHARIIRQRLVE